MKSSDKVLFDNLKKINRWERFDHVMCTSVLNRNIFDEYFTFEDLKHWRQLKIQLADNVRDRTVEEMKALLQGAYDFTPAGRYSMIREELLQTPLKGKLP